MLHKPIGFAVALVLCTFLLSHDMWLETDDFFLQPGQTVVMRNGNGAIYQESENAVAVDRIASLFVVTPEGRRIEPEAPYTADVWTKFEFTPERAGNYWVALSSKPREIRLSGGDFTAYLEHDGIPNILREREEKGISDRDEVEQYSKYVKAYLQAGDVRSDNHDNPLGLTIEIVPLVNPYALEAGQGLPVRVLFQGDPLAGLTLHAGTDGQAEALSTVETDAAGEAEIPITESGKWYVRGIHLSQVDKQDHSYESYWCTLTFQIR